MSSPISAQTDTLDDLFSKLAYWLAISTSINLVLAIESGSFDDVFTSKAKASMDNLTGQPLRPVQYTPAQAAMQNSLYALRVQLADDGMLWGYPCTPGRLTAIAKLPAIYALLTDAQKSALRLPPAL